jgi:hypothetical protein
MPRLHLSGALLSGIISALVSIALALIASYTTIRTKEAELKLTKSDLDGARHEAAEARKEVGSLRAAVDSIRTTLAKEVAELSIGKKPDLDSGWLEIPANCKTLEQPIKLTDVPRVISAYYRLKTSGETFPLGTNQYGDANQTNGVLVDVDVQNGKVFVRLPCGSLEGNNAVHLGRYNGRNGMPGQAILNRTDVQFRLLIWQ